MNEETENIDDRLKEEFLEYKKMSEELAKAMEENKKLKQEREENKRLKGILAHEIRSPLNSIVGMTSLIESQAYTSEEERKSYFEAAYLSVEKISTLTEILALEGSSREELQRKSEVLILEDIAKEHAIVMDKYMKDEKISVRLKYNKFLYNKPIEIYANKAIITAVWGTLFSNSLERAPQFSRIMQGFRINRADNLEIIMENAYTEKRLREGIGLGKGMGIPFAESIVKTLNGNFQIYKGVSQIKKDYDTDKWWGYKESKSPNQNDRIYGIRITIPMKELKAPEKKEIQ